MKIAHIITRLVAGGAQRNTLTCAAYQQSIGHQVTVISGVETGSEGSLLEEARSADYTWVELPALVRRVNPFLDARALAQMCRLFAENRFDLVHTHTSKAGILGRLAAAICRTPVVVHTPHGHVFHSYFSDWKAKVFEVLERWTAPLADTLVMLSGQELADHLAAGIGNKVRTVVIPSGVDISQLQKITCASEGFVVGYVGRLADIKGPLDLVEAFAIHRTTHPQSRLLIVGDGPQRAEVESLIHRHQLGTQVEMLGWRADVTPHLQRMSLLAVPSHNEGMGRVVVEAMAAGLPVVASGVGGLLDLVEDGSNGKLVPPKDPGAWAQVLNDLAAQRELLDRFGKAGRSRAELYSQAVMLSRLEALYSHLARIKGLRPVPTTPKPNVAR